MVSARSVLVVEDDRIVQMHLRVLLQELGFVVTGVASNAEEALACAGANRPQAVLMDVRLRGGRDGIETARVLREHCDPALVFLTAHADEATVERALGVGALGYLVKPFSKPQLRAALSTALAEHEKRAHSERERRTLADAVEHGEPRRASATGERVPFGAGTRMVIFSHDTLGLGHLQRCTNIARALTQRHPGLSVMLLTGSPAVHRFALPEGVDYVKLPSVRKVSAEQYSARTLGVSDGDVLKLRSNLILRTVRDYDPHALLVDHAPTGMKGEMLPTLEWLAQHRPDCTRMIGLRDIIDDPESVKALWKERGTYDLLRKHYERILVYGSPDVFATATEYGFPDDLRERTRYCNYVGEGENAAETEDLQLPADDGRPLVVVTIGGGDGAGETVIGNYLGMLERADGNVPFRSVILPGPFLPSELNARYEARARSVGAVFLGFVPSSSPYLAAADLVVGTTGYNTTTQTLRYGKRALFIPRVMHRDEQLVRARRLAEMGLVECLPPQEVTPEVLGERVRAMLADPREALTEARVSGRVRFDGAEQVAEVCAGLVVRAEARGGVGGVSGM